MNIVEDIYDSINPLLNNKSLKISEDLIEKFGESMKNVLRHWAKAQDTTKKNIRMSNIGKPARRMWYDMKYNTGKNTSEEPYLPIKFLYGHMLEEVLLFLIEFAGHKATDQQKEVELNGIKGHIDCKIDGEIIDIKTASSFAFNKFKKGTLATDDPFGYLAQLSGYEEAEGTNQGGFLVINKESGELVMYKPDELDKPNSYNLITKIKNSLLENEPPEKCYEPVAEGKAGNLKLPKNCGYCPHKFRCYPNLRVFQYSKGLTYLTKVVSEPKVPEVWL